MKSPIIDVANSYFRQQARSGDMRHVVRYLWIRIGHPIIIATVWFGLVTFLYRYLLNSHDLTNNIQRLGEYGIVILFMGMTVATWFSLRSLLRRVTSLFRSQKISLPALQFTPLEARIITVMHDEQGNIQEILRR